MNATDRYYPCLFCGKLTPRRLIFDDCPPAPSCSPECDNSTVHVRYLPDLGVYIGCMAPTEPPVVVTEQTETRSITQYSLDIGGM